jgi:hypothetical protein
VPPTCIFKEPAAPDGLPAISPAAATTRRGKSKRRFQVEHKRCVTIGLRQSEELWNFYSRFVDCPRGRFMSGIVHADEIYRLRGLRDDLLGFAALQTIGVEVEGKWRHIVYVLYTDVEDGLRGRVIVHRLALARYVRFRLRHPLLQAYVMFSASTAASYLIMARSLPEHWPRAGQETPPEIRHIVEAAMARLAIEGWDPERGVLRRHGQLRYRESRLGETRLAADAAFYKAQNPGQQSGDSLICLFPVNLWNALGALCTMVRRALRRKPVSGWPAPP